MHLYYARFFCHFFYNMGWIAQREPFKNLLTQGMIRGQTFSNAKTGEFFKRSDIDFSGATSLKSNSPASGDSQLFRRRRQAA